MLAVVSVFMTAFSSAAFGAENEALKAAEDESKLMNSESLGVLSAVGIITAFDDGTYGLDQNLTRADLAVYAARMLGYNEAEVTENTYFKDVPNYHWAASSVEKLVQRGIISPDTEYRPDDNATMLEVIKVMVGLAGYDTLAKAKGGYPTGYRSVASQIGILSGVDGVGGDTCLRYKAFEIMFNTMTIDALEQTMYGGETGKYEKTGETMLSLYHDIYKIEDRVNGVWGISIDEKEKPEKGKLRVGDKLMSSENIKNSESFLGHSVICYFRDNGSTASDEFTAVYIKDDDESIKINADDITEYNNYKLSYNDKKDKKSSLSIDSAAIIIKNGAVVSQNISKAFDIKAGTIELVGDSPYKTVIINEIQNVVCGSIDLTNSLIYAERGKIPPINVKENGERTVRLRQDSGMEIELSDISHGELLNVIQSENYVDISVSTQSLTVKIDSINVDDKYAIIKSGDEEYKIPINVYTAEKINISPGKSVRLQLNSLGIAADVGYSNGDAAEKWGYVYKVSAQRTFGCDINLKVYTSEQEVKIMKLADSVKMDEKKYDLSKESDANAVLSRLNARQIIVYKTNANDEIFNIDTGERSTAENENTLKCDLEWGMHNFIPWKLFQPMSYVEESTMVLSIPGDDEIDDAEESDFSVKSINDAIKFQWARDYKCAAYKFNGNSFVCDIIVMDLSSNQKIGMDESWNYLFVVDDVISTVNSKGDVVTAIDVCTREGAHAIYTMADNKPICDSRGGTGNRAVEKGDCVMAAFQTDTEMLELQIMYDASEKQWLGSLDGTNRRNGIGADNRVSLAYFSKFYGEYGTWAYEIGGEAKEGGKLSDAPMIKVENIGGKIRIDKADSSALRSYEDAKSNCSKIIAQAHAGELNMIVIYEED